MSNQQQRVIGLFGAGVLANGWRPVIRALQDTDFPDVSTISGANFALARLVHVGREACGANPLPPDAQEQFRKLSARVRRAIAVALVEAQARDELSVREEFIEVVRTCMVGNDTQVALVTTNWDMTVERALGANGLPDRVAHLHGSCDLGAGLYLPTEIAEEPFRTSEEREELVNIRGALVKLMQGSTRLVLYGLAVSPLDAELGQVLASGLNESRVREVLIVDPRYPEVAERVAGLTDMGKSETRVVGAHPKDLGTRWSFHRDLVEAEMVFLAQRFPGSV